MVLHYLVPHRQCFSEIMKLQYLWIYQFSWNFIGTELFYNVRINRISFTSLNNFFITCILKLELGKPAVGEDFIYIPSGEKLLYTHYCILRHRLKFFSSLFSWFIFSLLIFFFFNFLIVCRPSSVCRSVCL